MTDLFKNKSKSHVEPGDKLGEAQDLDQQRDKYCVLFGVELTTQARKSHRAVFASADGDLHVGLYDPGDQEASFELSFTPQKAVDLASLVLAGDPVAMTMPGAMRIISACLLDAAYRDAERASREAERAVRSSLTCRNATTEPIGEAQSAYAQAPSNARILP